MYDLRITFTREAANTTKPKTMLAPKIDIFITNHNKCLVQILLHRIPWQSKVYLSYNSNTIYNPVYKNQAVERVCNGHLQIVKVSNPNQQRYLSNVFTSFFSPNSDYGMIHFGGYDYSVSTYSHAITVVACGTYLCNRIFQNESSHTVNWVVSRIKLC